jgi:hypothetical protein
VKNSKAEVSTVIYNKKGNIYYIQNYSTNFDAPYVHFYKYCPISIAYAENVGIKNIYMYIKRFKKQNCDINQIQICQRIRAMRGGNNL